MTKQPSDARATVTGSPRSRPTTRSSIRQSLNLAGKALADVISKDTKDTDKSAKKSKDTSSRRLSAMGLKPAAPRASMGDAKSPFQPLTTRTPDSKTLTRSRASAGFQAEEQPAKPLDAAGSTRTSMLRPKTAATSSALPKYRPKSVLVEKPPSPRTGTRRPLSSSEDEKEYRNKYLEKGGNTCSPLEKTSRPISPLPQRAALKNLNTTVNATPPATPTKSTSSVPSSSKSSPHRPTKLVKTAASASASGAASAIPRPSSSTSSAGSFTPHTPKTPQLRNASAIRRSAQTSPSPRPTSINDSPLGRPSRDNNNIDGSPFPKPAVAPGNMSHISEVDSEDSEAEDVALLLAPVAALGAPTPAMPRIQGTRNRRRPPPQTPTRTNFLPSRENMSYLSPLPPDPESPGRASLRPPQQQSGKQARGSILSWEQLASEASKTLGEDEIENMLSDMSAPFHPGAVSPALSTIQLEVPESPCLSTLSSPGGYGSISQVLLPDVTPSPAVYHNSQRYEITPEVSAIDAATVTLLRLQLAAAENMAKERLYQLQNMEEEMHNLKTLRGREAQDLMKQVVHMEEQLQGSFKLRERTEEERMTYISELEIQLRQVHDLRDQAVAEAAKAARDTAFKSQRDACEIDCIARVAISEWESVRLLSDMELDLVRGDRHVLSVLLAELDGMTQHL